MLIVYLLPSRLFIVIQTLFPNQASVTTNYPLSKTRCEIPFLFCFFLSVLYLLVSLYLCRLSKGILSKTVSQPGLKTNQGKRRNDSQSHRCLIILLSVPPLTSIVVAVFSICFYLKEESGKKSWAFPIYFFVFLSYGKNVHKQVVLKLTGF